MFEKIKNGIKRLIRFLSHDIWRVSEKESSSRRIGVYNIIKSFILTFRNINGSELNTRAAALTYSTLLSIVPLLAVLFAIARGFGFQNIVRGQISEIFVGQEETLNGMMVFIDNSIEYAQGGVFLGIGVVLLMYTVINLLSNIERNFNNIWQIKKGRTYYRWFTDYLALIIVMPIFLVCNAGLSIMLGITENWEVVGFVMSPFVKTLPYAIPILFFTFLFIYIPNTKVKFSSALVGGLFTGICFQLFQQIFIGGQIWISKYNAIYGSFAALPLLLLWMQLSWFFIMIGVELSFAFQNVNKFDFEYETQNISRRYRDFVILLLMTLIVKRFEKGENPYTADELSEQHKIPTKLTSETLFYLQDVGLIVETPSEEDLVPAYVPAIDINQLSVSFLFEKIDLYGSEDFKIDVKKEFKEEWDTILDIRNIVDGSENYQLLKDL